MRYDRRRGLVVALDHAVVEAALAVQLGLLEAPLHVEQLHLAALLVELPIDLPQLGGPLLGARLGLLDLPVDLVDLGLVLLLLLRPASPASDALSFSRSTSWNSRWTSFQGRKWSATTIQTVASSIAIEVIAKTRCRIGCER